jgi:4-amino-4-deoxy-L-arabinose transferase-like glycosyltransferase
MSHRQVLVEGPPEKLFADSGTRITDSSNRRWTTRLALIALIALTLRIGWIIIVDNSSVGVWADEGAGIALNMLAGKGYIYSYGTVPPSKSFRVPVFPLTLFLLWSIFGVNLLLTKVVMAVLSAASAVLAGIIGKEVFNPAAGLMAAVLVALFPSLIYWTGTLGPETLTTFLLLLTLLLMLRGNFFYSGLMLGALILTRGVFLPFVVVAVIWILLKGCSWSALRSAALFCVAVALAMAPWVYRNWLVHGSVLLLSTEGGLIFYECNNAAALANRGDWQHNFDFYSPELKAKAQLLSEVAFDQLLYERGFKEIWANQQAFTRAFVSRVYNFWRSSPRDHYAKLERFVMLLTWLPAVLLALMQMYLARAWRNWKCLLLITVLLVVTAAYGCFYSVIRYRAPLEPVVLVFAAGSLSRLLISAGSRNARRQVTA